MDLANYRCGHVSSIRVSLWAGEQKIGAADFSASQMAELFDYGKWSTLTIDIDGSAYEAADGQQLRVEVANLSNDDRRDEINVDYLRLAKLTGVMATFDSGSAGGLDSRSLSDLPLTYCEKAGFGHFLCCLSLNRTTILLKSA